MTAQSIANLIMISYIFILVFYILAALLQEFLRTKNFNFLIMGAGFFGIALGLLSRVAYILWPKYLFFDLFYRGSALFLMISLALVLLLILLEQAANRLTVGLFSASGFFVVFVLPVLLAEFFEANRNWLNIGLSVLIIIFTITIYYLHKQREILYFLVAILVMAATPNIAKLEVLNRYYDVFIYSGQAVGIMLLALGIGRLKKIVKKGEKETIFGYLSPTNQSIGIKILTGFLVSALIPLVTISYISYSTASGNVSEAALESLRGSVNAHAQEMNLMLEGYRNAIIFLSYTPPVQGIIRAKDNDGIDPTDETTYQLWTDRLALIFDSLARTSSDYMQLRYLDESGQEMVRVDSDKQAVIRIDDNQLQNKADRYYFTETVKLPAESIYVSALDLNKEGTPPSIEVPHKPVIRYATPVYDQLGQNRGMIIINLFADRLLNAVQHVSADKLTSNHDLGVELLLDEQGYYIVHPDESKRWGGLGNLNTGESLASDYDELMAESILSGEVGVIDMIDHEHMIAYEPIYPDSANHDNSLVVVKIVPRATILASAISLRNIMLILSLGFLLIIMVVAYLVSRSIAKPIEKLRRGAEIIQEGNLDHKVGTKDQDEIGQLSRAFDKMTDAIKKSRADVDRKVEEQTSEIVRKSADLEEQKKAILNILEDVEAEKTETAKEKLKSDAVLGSIGDGIIATDQDGQITILNISAQQMLGWSFEDVKGKSVVEVLKVFDESGQEIPLYKRPSVVALSSGQKVVAKPTETYYYERRNKTRFAVGITVTPFILEDQIIGTVIVFRDVSLEKNIDQAKTEFVSLASHQLRTPLSTINWYAEMLIAGDAGKMNANQLEYLREIYKGNQRMVDLVNALLNVSRIELGTFVVEPKIVDIFEIADSVLDELKPQIEKKKMKLSKSYDQSLGQIKVDPKLTRIIFQNLLSNAVKYTPEKGSIELAIKKENESVSIMVKDSGYGVPKQQQSKMFSKLFRADNVKEKDTEGTGLGLYIIKAIVDAAKGDIRFESEEDKGTTFFVTLPLTGMAKKEGTKSLS